MVHVNILTSIFTFLAAAVEFTGPGWGSGFTRQLDNGATHATCVSTAIRSNYLTSVILGCGSVTLTCVENCSWCINMLYSPTIIGVGRTY